jgi:hypothetical protein
MKDKELLGLFKKWLLSDDNEFYLDGIAGCGKSTQVAISLLPYYLEQFPGHIVQVIAPTHAAKQELQAKIDYLDESNFHTMHSYVGMAPETNEGAVDLNNLQRNRRVREAMEAHFVVIDEAGMADEECAGVIKTLLKTKTVSRVMYLGDKHQLLPVKGKQLLTAPEGFKWHYVLRTNYRARKTPDVQQYVYDLYARMEKGGKSFRFAPEASENLGFVSIAEANIDPRFDRALAFTRRGVQEFNEAVVGRDHAIVGDIVFSPTSKKHYRVEKQQSGDMAEMIKVRTARGNWLDDNSDKFHTRGFIGNLVDVVEGLKLLQLQQVEVRGGEWAPVPGTLPEWMFATYGTHRHGAQLAACREGAINANNKIVEAEPSYFAGLTGEQVHERIMQISQEHWSNPLVQARRKAWRKMYSWEQTILCIDAPFCTTVHAAQGATHRRSFIDHDDLKYARSHGDTYVRLLYVAISRATEGVYFVN